MSMPHRPPKKDIASSVKSDYGTEYDYDTHITCDFPDYLPACILTISFQGIIMFYLAMIPME